MQSNDGQQRGQPGVARSALIKIGAILLGIALVLLSLTTLFRQHASDEATSDGRDTSRFVLPARSLDATEILGRQRDSVRDILGQPSRSDDLIDTFNLGIAVDIRYENDKAIGLTLSAPDISRNERKVRRWLQLPGDGPLVIGGTSYRLTYTVGDSTRLSLSPEGGQPLPVPMRAVVPSSDPAAPPSSAEALLKTFPNLPPKVRAGCRSVANGRALSCGGLNARVSVELDASGSPISLTVFDPPGRATEESCRSAIEQNIEGATLTARRFFSSPKVDAVYAFAVLAGAKAGGSCSLMVCRKPGELEGGRSPCGATH